LAHYKPAAGNTSLQLAMLNATFLKASKCRCRQSKNTAISSLWTGGTGI
jgi:hypothetical protein